MSKNIKELEPGVLANGVPIRYTLEQPMAIHFFRYRAGKPVKAFALEYDFDKGFFTCIILNWDSFQSSDELIEIAEIQQAMSLPAVKEYIQQYANGNAAKDAKFLGSIDVQYSDRKLTLDVTAQNNFIGLERNSKLLLVISLPELSVCTADDCSNIFAPAPRGREQRYCSKACKMREYRRRRKARSESCV